MRDRRELVKLDKIQKKKKKLLIRKLIFSGIIFLVLFIASVILVKNEKFLISNINIVDSRLINIPVLKSNLENSLNKKFLLLYPKKNIFLLPQRKIKKEILANNFLIKNVFLKIEQGELVISVEERKPAYLSCLVGNLEITENKGVFLENKNCYFFDSDGFVYSSSPDFSDNVFLRFYTQEVEYSFLGKNILLPKELNKIIEIKNNIEKSGIKISGFFINQDNYYFLFKEDDLIINYSYVVVKKDSDPEKIFRYLNLALNSEPLISKIKIGQKIIYLDLRFHKKVYYRFYE